jgi:hypothetical protein
VTFLQNQYDADVNLLRESPVTAPDAHWLLTDNRLAQWALTAAGEDDLAAQLAAALDRYKSPPHGLIEALTGAAVPWPPRTPVPQELAPGVKVETRTGGAVMHDWPDYADLALYGALDAANQGDENEARRRYAAAGQMFDGTGFQDRAFDGRYTTYKLALALIAAARVGVQPDLAVRERLLALQGADGGFYVHYTPDGPVGDANTETTAYALLALTAPHAASRQPQP